MANIAARREVEEDLKLGARCKEQSARMERVLTAVRTEMDAGQNADPEDLAAQRRYMEQAVRLLRTIL
jgi:hypothetical protein